MTDRELLELAAKAAGIEGRYASLDEFPDWMTVHDGEGIYYTSSQAWSPLTHDSDALRLAVRLELAIDYSMRDPTSRKMATICVRSDSVVVYDVLGTDPYAATRRAIVRAAAEIGRAMK